MKPRVLFVARGPIRLPLDSGLATKWGAVRDELSFRVLATGEGRDEEFRLAGALPAVDGPAFYAACLPGSRASFVTSARTPWSHKARMRRPQR